MTYHDKLDFVLLALSKAEHKYFEGSQKIKARLNFEITDTEIELLLEHLVSLGFASYKETIKSAGIFSNTSTLYRVTIQGLLFLEKSSFKSEIKTQERSAIWITAKTIASIANAIMIVIIGAASVYVAKQSNDDKIENKKLHHTVDSLTTINKIYDLKKSDTAVTKDTTR